jgi:hypothetical protein
MESWKDVLVALCRGNVSEERMQREGGEDGIIWDFKQ